MEKSKYSTTKIIMLLIVTIAITTVATTVGIKKYFQENMYVLLGSGESKMTFLDKLEGIDYIINQNYLGEINKDKLNEGAIKGYVAGLGDPYTEYIPKEDFEEYMQDTSGIFFGIGIYMVKTDDNQIGILSPIEGSPAEEAGILPGDCIVAVNGVSYTGEQLDIASKNIKGEDGSIVELEIIRGTENLNLKIERREIIINPVHSEMLENNIGKIEFRSFDEDTAEQFETQLVELKNKGMKALIIDLRNNGGGIIYEALEIADLFTNKGEVLLYEVDKNQKEKTTKAKKDKVTDVPVVILTNEYTASSSEILAGALKDLGIAKTVGTTTYGKGIIQQIMPLSDGSGLKVTIEKYLTPNRNEIHKIGINTDFEVGIPEEFKNQLTIPAESDTQLKKAIEICK